MPDRLSAARRRNGYPNWPALRDACAREAWQRAYAAAGPCPGPEDAELAAWHAAAACIEAAKAAALLALVAHWRTHKEPSRP